MRAISYLLLGSILLGSAVESRGENLTLDARNRLFLDDAVVASMKNVTRTIHPAEKFPGNPVLTASEPWEGAVVLVYGSVLREDDGTFRMWYYCSRGVAYAESDDGIAWRKPALDISQHDGRPTNLVVDKEAAEGAPGYLPHFYELFGVFKDPREPNPNRRYKMGFLSIQRDYDGPRQDPFHGGQHRGLGVAASPDGIHWTLIDNWATEAICDGATHWMHDVAGERYVLYGRTKHVPDTLTQAWGDDAWFNKYFWGRAVARVESPDFLNWNLKDPASAPVVMEGDTNDPVATEIYGMNVFPYGAQYVALVQRFHNRPEDVFLDLQLAVSHDTIHFQRVGDRAPFIPCGGIGSWDRFNNSAANNAPIEVGDELRFYYAGRTYRHSPYEGADKGVSGGAIGFASVPRDRFVSLGASFDGGTVVTKPMTLAGGTLHLNADADFGTIAIEVISNEGKIIAKSAPVNEDSLDIAVEWAESSIESIEGPVSLRFRLENALLYAFWCE
jgi:hypothetical protein